MLIPGYAYSWFLAHFWQRVCWKVWMWECRKIEAEKRNDGGVSWSCSQVAPRLSWVVLFRFLLKDFIVYLFLCLCSTDFHTEKFIKWKFVKLTWWDLRYYGHIETSVSDFETVLNLVRFHTKFSSMVKTSHPSVD